MDNQHLNAYYPDRETMEDRYFRIAQSRQRITLQTWLIAAGISFGAALFFLMIGLITEAAFFAFLFYAATLALVICITGVSIYFSGYHFLEKAELLYNTRMAGKALDEDEAKSVASHESDDTAARLTRLANEGKSAIGNYWICQQCDTRINIQHSRCDVCGAFRNSTRSAHAAAPTVSTKWTCKTCGKQNSVQSPICRNCGEYR